MTGVSGGRQEASGVSVPQRWPLLDPWPLLCTQVSTPSRQRAAYFKWSTPSRR